jgi:hypothetical protein
MMTVTWPDADGDGVSDLYDNCPQTFNPMQQDSDTDGIGDDCECLAADLDGSGTTNFADFTILAHDWHTTDSAADTNRDGIVDITDLTQLTQWWLISCN